MSCLNHSGVAFLYLKTLVHVAQQYCQVSSDCRRDQRLIHPVHLSIMLPLTDCYCRGLSDFAMIFNLRTTRVVEAPRRLILLVGVLLSATIYLSIIYPDIWTLPKLHRNHDPASQTTSGQIQQPFRYPNGVFDDTAEGAAKVSQVSMQFGDHFDAFYERALRTHLKHGTKWGYPTHFLRQDIIGKQKDSQGESVYSKLLYLQTIMVNEMIKPFGKRSEWLVWFDADTVLTNNEVPWTIFLPPSNTTFQGINLLVTTDERGFNAGIFLIRVCEWSIDLLSDAVALPRLRPDLNLSFKEQSALRDRFDVPNRRSHRLYVPRHWFNPYDLYYQGLGEQVMYGTMVIHFPGITHEQRAESMGLWLDELDHTPRTLNVPLVNTSYPAETEAFWTWVGAAMEAQTRASKFKEDVGDGQAPHTFDDLNEAEKKLCQAIEEAAFNENYIRAMTRDLCEVMKKTRENMEDTKGESLRT